RHSASLTGRVAPGARRYRRLLCARIDAAGGGTSSACACQRRLCRHRWRATHGARSALPPPAFGNPGGGAVIGDVGPSSAEIMGKCSYPGCMNNRTTPPAAEAASAEPFTFQPIRSTRAFEEIAAQIRTELAEGRLRVGNRLPSERALSEQFGVSRNTLREALRSLEHAGLLRLQKGASGGAFITEVKGDTITTSLLDMFHVGAIQPEKLTEARIWLESIIVREACLRAKPADWQLLRDNIRQAEQARSEGDFHRRAETHFEF